MHAGCNKFKQYRKYTEKVKVNLFLPLPLTWLPLHSPRKQMLSQWYYSGHVLLHSLLTSGNLACNKLKSSLEWSFVFTSTFVFTVEWQQANLRSEKEGKKYRWKIEAWDNISSKVDLQKGTTQDSDRFEKGGSGAWLKIWSQEIVMWGYFKYR